MTLESLAQMKFSIKLDVTWHLVSHWELFTLGLVPYPTLGWNIHFVTQLRNGLRLLKPDYASDSM